MVLHRYRAFGPEIVSEIALPMFAPGEADQIDVEILLAPVSANPKDAETIRFRSWIAKPGMMVLDVPDVARFRIEGGKRIFVDLAEGSAPSKTVPLLQGSALAAILQQRRQLPMHAGAIETSRGAMLLIGTSGVGKSTLTNAFVQRGYRMMCDDVAPVSLDQAGRPQAVSGFPGSRLWRDSVQYFGHDVSKLTKAHDDLEKYYVIAEDWCDKTLPVAAVVVLHAAANGTARIEEIEPAERVRWLLRYSFRRKFLNGFKLNDMQFHMVSAMAAQAEMVRLVRPSIGAPAAELAELLECTLAVEPAQDSARVGASA